MNYQKILALMVVLIGFTVLIRNNLASSDVSRYVSLGANIHAWTAAAKLSDDQIQDIRKASAMDSAKCIFILRETKRDLLLTEIFSAFAVLYGVLMYFQTNAPNKKSKGAS